MSSDFKSILRSAYRSGCTVARHKKHLVIITPSGRQVIASSSASDKNAVHSFRRDLIRAGVNLEAS